MHSSSWRSIGLIRAPANIQMAIDYWLFEQHRAGKLPPVLRFYTWDPLAISLGYHQRRWPDGWRQLSWHGQPIDLVRRPTGGRAVLHQGDLTYMVVMSELGANSCAIAKSSRLAAYETICQFLIEGWRSLGVELHYGRAGRGYAKTPNCFATATGADLVLPNGAKFIGSAQLKRGGAILQHGSILLNPSVELFSRVFDPQASQLIGGVHLLPDSLPRDVSKLIEMAIASLLCAASRCFEVEIHHQPLTREEWQHIKTDALNLPVFAV
ncbi:lipoate--protein ligase family protein [Phormidium sp. CCY1219]|uniref:lipoate--protein ligase family protein n=1 Tax=Phormidium sp. CCY1219 TaxID=2886104 RepID=UPI002D1F16B4|nr:biotin/lipoate A/B protein ligase family protein [Phormidium sp. CCY1219]MEB3829225.1 lipoate--protein ligase family protein [Phormidium sp. CCY1219]